MRFGPDDKFWVVTDPTPESETADILVEASLRLLDLQLKGGLTIGQHPTLFTQKAEAEIEAHGRLVAMLASQAIARRAADGVPLSGAHRISVMDKDGKVLLEVDLR